MTDYWKSSERKYCDFCKCWITDNKASVAFHEDGKRHKLAVAKRITEISRNSEKSERERQKMNADIRKMEEAAMRSYAQDIHASGDMTSRNINAVMAATAAAGGAGTIGPSISHANVAASTSKGRSRQVDPLRLPGNSDDEDDGNKLRVNVAKVDPESIPNASLWVEGKSDEGHTYYWNVKTNESVWTAPKEGFLSYEEYERINELAVKQQSIQAATEAKKFRENVNEEVAKYNRERLKQFRRRETPEEKEAKKAEKNAFKTEEQAATKEIGAWQVVHEKPPPEAIDWQLPQVNHQYIAPVVSQIIPEPPSKRFKEKTIVALAEESTVGVAPIFKKRKFSAKANARQRLNDD